MPGGGTIVNVSSDAAVESYPGWGGYGSSKAALDQLTAILAAEHPALRIYSVDPGDMRTQMHQDAFPGEDISDRPLPEDSVPGLLALIEGELPERPLPGAGAGRGRGAADERAGVRLAPDARGPASPPRRAGSRATGCGCWSPAARTARSSTRHSASCPSCSRPATCSWSTSRRRSRPRLTRRRRRDGEEVRVHFATRAPHLDADWRVVEFRSADGEPAAPPAAPARSLDAAPAAPRSS